MLDRTDLDQVLRSLADEVLALPWPHDPATFPWLVGIRSGGVAVAEELAAMLTVALGFAPQVGALDITLYRDDMWLKGPRAAEGQTALPGDLTGRRVVLVDDVLYTGRTVRAALNALVDFGRPRAVALAVLLDRGGRELPIAADAVGHVLAVPPGDKIQVRCDARGRLHSVVQVPVDAGSPAKVVSP
ncbi:MAG: bifunctional pyr operon transcriptional regulator/uracil phosphoribosyltransferase PyrR [Deltaproteobacteria bacterium]|nr:bifunctional pyr operon transcriptional regulator/uracil phosphoribosyltransferase PyrR [Deltaproteobacteria bacterium]